MLSRAMRFVVLIGVVSFFADMTYEGMRSVVGPYLGILGANAAVIGAVAGSGELAGYGVRLLSGTMADRTGKVWVITILGYVINLFAVPLLALAGSWPIAAVFVIAERIGKGLRTPSRDAMLSHATQEIGHGWGFGLHEAMDQAGAMVGPIAVAVALFFNAGYRFGFAILGVPAVAAILVLLFSRREYPNPSALEPISAEVATAGFPRAFWIYALATALVAAGFADWALIAYRMQVDGVVASPWIPIAYAVAMGLDGVASLAFGRFFDRAGRWALGLGFVIGALFAPFAFLGTTVLLVGIGVALWGIGLGCQESIMRAAVAQMIGRDRRGSAFGVFNIIYGSAWFAGSAAMGILYTVAVPYLVLFSISTQLAAVPLLAFLGRGPLSSRGVPTA